MTASRRWLATAGSAVIMGLVVGVPYYSLPYFYDYFEHPVSAGGFGWSRDAIVLGLPLGTLIPLFAGPLLARRVPPRVGIVSGAAVCAAAIAGFGFMQGNLAAYYGLWILYMVGWSFAGPMNHQLLLTRLFESNQRGLALALAFFGLSLFGAGSVVFLAKPLTELFGFQRALGAIGAVMLLAVPIAWITLPPQHAAAYRTPSQKSPLQLRRNSVFWLLLFGSTLTIAGIGGITQHLKLILRERGFSNQSELDEVFGWTVLLMLSFSALGRFVFGWSADRLPKKHVLTTAFVFMLAAIPLLYRVGSSAIAPYVFAVCFGFGMSADTLLLTLLAAERFGSESLARVMAFIVPVNALGQTWFPFLVSLLWGVSGSYNLPLAAIFVCILGGRFMLMLVTERHAEPI